MLEGESRQLPWQHLVILSLLTAGAASRPPNCPGTAHEAFCPRQLLAAIAAAATNASVNARSPHSHIRHHSLSLASSMSSVVSFSMTSIS